MRVAAERKAEMARVGGALIGLRLAAQKRLHDLGQPVVLRKAVDQPVEHRGGDHLPQREALFEGFEIVFQADELFAARGLVDAVHHRRLFSSEEHTSELQSLMRSSYAVFCLNKKPDR